MRVLTEKDIKLSRLRQFQSLSLSGAVRRSEMLVYKAMDHFEAQMYIAISGKDSCAGANLVWSLYPRVPAVFVDTGNEYEGVKQNIYRMIDEGKPIEIIKPDVSFWDVNEKYGWPILSKQICTGINRFVNTKSFTQKRLRAFGGINPTSGKKQQRTVPLKYHYILKAVLAGKLKVTTKCCSELKIKPFEKYEKTTGRKPFVFTMASNSMTRLRSYLKNGCNAFSDKGGVSRPLMCWTEQHVLEYIKSENITIASDYGEILEKPNGILKCEKADNTGCKFCMFGIQFEKDREVNRIQRLATTAPESYAEFIEHGGGDVMDLLEVEWRV